MVEYPIVVYDAPTWTVYMHINKNNGKKYIGITHFKDLQKRWRNGHGYGESIMQKAINKHGWQNFDHIILLQNLQRVMANIMEFTLIKYYDTHISNNHGYNWQFGGFFGPLGMKMAPEQIEKISGANNWKAEPVVCLNTGKIYETQKSAANENNIKNSCGIGAACDNKMQFCGHDNDGVPLIWVRYNEYLKMTEEEKKNKLNATILNTNSHQVICLNTHEVFNTVKDACDYCGASNSGIIRCCQTHIGTQTGHPRYHSGRHPVTKEWLSWMFLSDFNALSEEEKNKKLCVEHNTNTSTVGKSVICLNTLEVFDNINKVSLYTTLKSAGNIRIACRDTNKYCGRHLITNEELHWMYTDEYKLLTEDKRKLLYDQWYTGSFLILSKEE